MALLTHVGQWFQPVDVWCRCLICVGAMQGCGMRCKGCKVPNFYTYAMRRINDIQLIIVKHEMISSLSKREFLT